MQKLIVYTAVIAFAGVGGLMAGFLMSNAEPAPDIATPVPLADQAAEAAAGAAERDPSTRPRVTLTQLDGSRAAIDDWTGQPLLVNFWATWCAPCLREIPLLKSIQDDAPIEGLQILGVAHDELDPVRDFVDEMGFNYPVLVGEFEAMAAAEAFGVELIALPLT
ncbi:MAG: TlpA disulfide reductase family protein, partial [Pseudomonadota bacterium]